MKYHSKWTECRQGHKHASKKEAIRCNELTMFEKSKEIKNLEQQPVFLLQPSFRFHGEVIKAITYKADFSYDVIKYKKFVVEDVKGFKTQLYKLKKKLFLFTMRNKEGFEFLET